MSSRIHLLGSSLGEYAAAVVSRQYRTPRRRCGCSSGEAEGLHVGPRGGMLAVITRPDGRDRPPALPGREVAARNYPGHTPRSRALDADLDRAEAVLRAADVLHQRVPVEYAYHSSLMDGVLAECRAAFDGVAFAPPRIPCVVRGRTARRAARCRAFLAGRPAGPSSSSGPWPRCGPAATSSTSTWAPQTPRARTSSGATSAGWPLPFAAAAQPVRPRPRLPGTGPTLAPASRLAPSTPAITHSQTAQTAQTAQTTLTAQTTSSDSSASGDSEDGKEGTPHEGLRFPRSGVPAAGAGQGTVRQVPAETEIADRVLGYLDRGTLRRRPGAPPGPYRYTQPALYVVSVRTHLDRLRRRTPSRPTT
ncbi:hypothetical protein LV779_39140 [Streptomyces thinghirensis]|nr:hypothetical protein [Streptomyces thinghirensis]